MRELCDEHGVLLIADEIATGFGRTGRLFACEHAGIAPDILCVGKALTGGYADASPRRLRAPRSAAAIAAGEPGVFMHGPTFMGNPLAVRGRAREPRPARVRARWRERRGADRGAACARASRRAARCRRVADVRVLGAIGVVELHEPVDMAAVQPALRRAGRVDPARSASSSTRCRPT